MQKKTKKITRASRQNIGYAYIAIWIIGFLVFKFYPFMSSLFYSFTNYNLFKESVENIGFANYEKIVDTAKYLKSYIVTFKYAFMTVPLKLLFALFIAYLLNFKIKGINLFRTAYYIPSILGGSVAIAVLWQFLFQNEGLVNTIIGLFGVKPINWLGSPDYALFVICLLRVWQFGSAMVIFLAALKGVPQDLYEAASIDGAGRCDITMTWQGTRTELPEFGLLFPLRRELTEVSYLGLGPRETTADRTAGGKMGAWNYNVRQDFAQNTPVYPQECGSRLNIGIGFAGDGMTFSALPYTPHELENARHLYELPRDDNKTVVRCAAFQRGVGGDNSWGAKPHADACFAVEKGTSFRFTIQK